MAGCVPLSAAPVAGAAPTTCTATFNLLIPGTWETNEDADPSQPVGMLKPVADALKAENGRAAEVYTMPYMARAFDNGHTYADSKADAIEKAETVLSNVANSCPNTRFTITGYSQGADAAGDLASSIGNDEGPIDPSRVLAVGLLADPGAGTIGATTVGPRTSGTGIADPRPQGMGKLSGRVASICAPGDLYCSIDKGSSPLLGSLGSILSKSPSVLTSGETVGGTSELASVLTSDVAGADLPALGSDVAALDEQLSAPYVDIKKVASTATSIAKSLAPLIDLLHFGTANPAASGQLAAAPAGTDERHASEVLTKAREADLASALETSTRLADTTHELSDGDRLQLPSTSAEVQALAMAAGSLGGQVAPVASIASDTLSSASRVFSVMEATVVVNQVLNVTAGMTALDIPGILNNLNQLPQRIVASDARGAHQIAGELNDQLSPLVKLAAGVDLKRISQVLAIMPDPSGATRIAAIVASILANVDITRLANIVGHIQEIAWTAVEKMVPPPGQPADPIGAADAMCDLIPAGQDLVSVAIGMISGRATKTSPELLGKQAKTVATRITAQAETLDLRKLSNALAKLSQSQGAKDLIAVASEGLTAASFFTSGAHTNYADLVVDNAGRTAIAWLSDWLSLQIGRAA